MILSRTMREKDYDEMSSEGQIIRDIHATIQMWNDKQHKHRLWEYALAQKVLTTVFGSKKGLLVSDHGCGAGYLSPILYWLGHKVWMYECWVFGNEEAFALEQMRKVGTHRAPLGGTYEMRNRPLCELVDADRGVDAAFCISTLEHIGEYQKAFRDLLSTVRQGGLVFLTTDFAEDETDHYQYSYLRAGKMFNKATYLELSNIAHGEGFEFLGGTGEYDWCWDDSCRLVNDYGFASLAMVKRREG